MTGAQTRRRWGLTDKLRILVRQARCPLCGEKLGLLDNCDFDHETALSIGGEDSLDNLRAVHRDCHAVKTFGTKATTAGGDIHAIAHTRRLTRKQEEFRRAVTKKKPGRRRKKQSAMPSRKFPKRRKAR